MAKGKHAQKARRRRLTAHQREIATLEQQRAKTAADLANAKREKAEIEELIERISKLRDQAHAATRDRSHKLRDEARELLDLARALDEAKMEYDNEWEKIPEGIGIQALEALTGIEHVVVASGVHITKNATSESIQLIQRARGFRPAANRAA